MNGFAARTHGLKFFGWAVLREPYHVSLSTATLAERYAILAAFFPLVAQGEKREGPSRRARLRCAVCGSRVHAPPHGLQAVPPLPTKLSFPARKRASPCPQLGNNGETASDGTRCGASVSRTPRVLRPSSEGATQFDQPHHMLGLVCRDMVVILTQAACGRIRRITDQPSRWCRSAAPQNGARLVARGFRGKVRDSSHLHWGD